VILVVEDEFLVRYDLASCLQAAGYVVIESANGEEAIAVCHSDAAIDIVITDVKLGGPANGWDVAERFRVERPDVSVLYTSGEEIDRRRCVPGSTFVPKPYRHSEILSACEELRGF
jgi:CheY-like chemotaxis protein